MHPFDACSTRVAMHQFGACSTRKGMHLRTAMEPEEASTSGVCKKKILALQQIRVIFALR